MSSFEKIKFLVNEKIYCLSVENLYKYHSTLTDLADDLRPKESEKEKKEAETIEIDEDSSVFEAVLHYHRTGLIVQPPTLAFELWQNRVNFWNLGFNKIVTEPNSSQQKKEIYFSMLDFVLYFGQQWIVHFDPQRDTILWKNEKKTFVGLFRYTEYIPFFQTGQSIHFMIGNSAIGIDNISIRTLKDGDPFEIRCGDPSWVHKRHVSEKTEELEESIEWMVKGIKTRNLVLEKDFWKGL